MRKFRGPFLLLMTAFIWGTAFVAQRVGSGYVGPVLFQSIRTLMGAASLLPIVLIRRRSHPEMKHPGKIACLACGAALGTAAVLQQIGITRVSAGKTGFISALYVVLVPIFTKLLGRRVSKGAWIGAPLAMLGLYLMSAGGELTFGFYEWVIVASAVGYAVHILVVGHFSPRVDGVELSFYQFLIAGLIYLPIGLIFEWDTMGGIVSAMPTMLYAGILSCGVAFTLQVLGQKDTSPAVAALIMCLESVFSAVSGAVILGERMTGKELAGCGLMLTAVVISQLSELYAARRA